VILERSWQSEEVLEDWTKAKSHSFLQEGQRGQSREQQADQPYLNAGKETELLGKHLQPHKVIGSNQCGFLSSSHA